MKAIRRNIAFALWVVLFLGSCDPLLGGPTADQAVTETAETLGIEISLCIVGDRSRDDEIYSTLRAAGLPISDESFEQVDFTRMDLAGISENPSGFYRRMSKQLAAARANPSAYAYVDWEYEGQNGLDGVPDAKHLAFTATLIGIVKEETGAKVGLWNPFGVLAKLPATTESSIETFRAVDELEPLDWVLVNGYIRHHAGYGDDDQSTIEPSLFANRLTHAITIGRELAQGREVVVSWQGLRRQGGKAFALTDEDVRLWWETIGANGVTQVVWWFDMTDPEQNDERIADAIRHAPIMLEALQSVEIK